MRLKDESIKYILDLQKSVLPLIYCCANKERLKVLENTARHYSGKIAFRDNVFNNDLDKINTLLIFSLCSFVPRYLESPKARIA